MMKAMMIKLIIFIFLIEMILKRVCLNDSKECVSHKLNVVHNRKYSIIKWG